MVKVLYGGGTAEMRGSNAGTTFTRAKSGSTAKARKRPTNPASQEQLEQRALLSLLSKAWGAELNENQRKAWNDFAALHTDVDILGQALQLSGQQMFIRLNTRTIPQFGPIQKRPPPNLDVTPMVSFSATINVSQTDFFLFLDPVPLTGFDRYQFFATPPLSPGRSFIKPFIRRFAKDVDPPSSPVNLFFQYFEKFGESLKEGQKVVFLARIIDLGTGGVTVPLRADVIAE